MLKFYSIEAIKIPENRQRKHFDPDKHQELVESIQYSATGLQHPIVVRVENDLPILVSGERRLRAMQDIYDLGGTVKFASHACVAGEVPCIDVGELSDIARMEAELEENILRVDLSWQERASATAALWKLRNAQAAQAEKPAPTMAEFTAEVDPSFDPAQRGAPQDNVRKDIILSRYLEDEDVANAKTAKEAYKVLKAKEQRKRNAELSAAIGENYSSSKHTLVLGNSLEWMKGQPDGQFDVILTDPPYGMGADEFGDSGVLAIGEHQYKDDWLHAYDLIDATLLHGYRLTKPDAHLYMFCDFDKFHEIKVMAESHGWKVFRTPMIWSKPSAFRAPWPDAGPRRTYECILFAVKGNKKVTKLAADVIEFNSDSNLGHNAQKPVALFVDLLLRSARPGDSVLDPFCGSGPIFPAAHTLQCYATGIELDPSAHGIAVKRLGDLI